MSVSHAASLVAREMEAIAGVSNVSHGREIAGVAAACTVRPSNRDEVAAVLRACHRNDWLVAPAGAYTKQGIGNRLGRVDVVLETTRLDGITHYDPGDLTLTIGAGARLADVLRTVTQQGQLLPLDPPWLARTTLGGTLATASSGPLAHRYGGAREFCVGIEYVTGEGIAAKAGGRVVKNVAGYDAMKLLVGSFGTLGVITAASFKLVPVPRGTRTFVLEFANAREMLSARDSILRSPLTPLALEMISTHAEQFVSATLNRSSWTLAVQAGGSDAVLARYARDLGSAVTQALDAAREADFWHLVREFPATVGTVAGAMVVNVVVAPSVVPLLLQTAEAAAVQNRFFCAMAGRATGALTLAFIRNAGARIAPEACAKVLDTLREKLRPDLSSYVVRAPAEALPHLPVWQSQTDRAAMLAVRSALDPRAILNRGRFLV